MQSLSCENEFYLHENKSHFHINGFAFSLALKQKLGATWKWLIKKLVCARWAIGKRKRRESLFLSSSFPSFTTPFHFPSPPNLVPRVFSLSYNTKVASLGRSEPVVCVKTRAHKTSGKTGNVQAMLQQGAQSVTAFDLFTFFRKDLIQSEASWKLSTTSDWLMSA